MHPHLQTLLDALHAEQRHQEGEHRRQVALPWPDRVAAGVSWPIVRPEALPGAPTWSGWEVEVVAPAALHDGIRPGDPVWVAAAETPDDGLRGTALAVDGARAAISVSAWHQGAPVDELALFALLSHPLAITRRFDPSTFERYAAALERAAEHRSVLKSALLGELAPPPPPETADGLPADLLRSLDPSQQIAAAGALAADPVALIHGPPGTGKTWTLARTLAALVARGERPWALADSNAAVDNLAVAAAEAGLDVVRLGHPARIGPRARHLSVDARVRAGLMGPALAKLDRDLDAARAGPTRGRGRLLGQLYRERREIFARARAHAIEGAQVIASTLGTLARVGPDLPPAKTALIDEATQAIEPAIWTAVPFVERLVLAGDPHQLGPVVTQPGNPLERSPMARLVASLPAPMLQTQRRMHRDVQSLVSPTYGPDYRPHPSVAEHRLVELMGVAPTPLTERSLLWIDAAGAGLDEARDPVSRSLYNPGEAALIGRAVRDLLDAGVPAWAIGVIAPYSAQVARLRAALPPEIEVATVNAFQGREKEAILCSFVRSNERGELGFVADPRRLTVAASRARRLWLGVGDSATLGASPAFEALFDALMAADAWATVWEPPWSEALDG